MYNKEEFGKKLNQLRRSSKKTIGELAEEIDMSDALLSNIFQGITYPSLDTFVKLVAALKLPAHDFICEGALDLTELETDLSLRNAGLEPKKQRMYARLMEAYLDEVEETLEQEQNSDE